MLVHMCMGVFVELIDRNEITGPNMFMKDHHMEKMI